MVRLQRTEVAKFGHGREASDMYLKLQEHLKSRFPQSNPQVFKLKWGTGQMAKFVLHMDFKDEEEMNEIVKSISPKKDEVSNELSDLRQQHFVDGSTYDTTLVTIESAE